MGQSVWSNYAPLEVMTYHLELRFGRTRVLLVALALHLSLGSLVLRLSAGIRRHGHGQDRGWLESEDGTRGRPGRLPGPKTKTIGVLTLPMMTVVRGVL